MTNCYLLSEGFVTVIVIAILFYVIKNNDIKRAVCIHICHISLRELGLANEASSEKGSTLKGKYVKP